MTVTARKYALLNRISPDMRQLTGLYILELAVILSWTLLLGTIFNLISGNWFILLPVSYLLAVTMLAWLERARTGVRGQCPLEAFGLAEISLKGFKPTEWQTLKRLLLTPPLLLLLLAGLIQLPRTGKTLLQIISGTKIVPLDTDMDPRPVVEIFRSRRKALMKVISYTMVSLVVAAIIILVPPELSGVGPGGRIASIHSLPEKDRELLAAYLEMKAMYPDSIEFHVRLASLYYRNNMEEDLILELEQIRILDPNHSILMLEEDLSITIEDLLVEQDSAFADSIPVTVTVATAPPAQEDTIDQDSALLLPDSVSLDLRVVASDSITAPVESVSTIDSVKIDDPVETDSLSLPTEEDSIPETVPPDFSPDETIPESLPDSIVTEDTSTVVSADSTETPGVIDITESPGDSTASSADEESIEPSETTPPPDPQPEPDGA